MDKLAWATVTPRKCRRHEWVTFPIFADLQQQEPEWSERCRYCNKPRDLASSRRGKNNRSRGNAIERWVCRLLGISRVGQYGGLEDGGKADEWLRVQVKSGGAHQRALLSKIHTIPANADQLRAWVTVSTPGPGHPREGVISFDLREFAGWYGKGTDEEDAA